MKIAIDAGHGLKTSGKRCLKSIDPDETREWTLNSRVAEQVCAHLEQSGAETLRVDDTSGAVDAALGTRTGRANAWGADYYISIHHNAGIGGGSGGGAVVFVYSGSHSGKSDILQKNVYDGLIGETGAFGNRAAPLAESNLYVLRHTNMPAVLVECGFMDSTTDTPMILTEAFAAKAAKGIAKGICRTAGIAFAEKPESAAVPVEPTETDTAALNVDGKIGPATVKRLQQVLGTAADGVISGQMSKYKVYWTAITSGACPWSGSKSPMVRALQSMIGVPADGLLGRETARALQAYLSAQGYACGSSGADGYFGTESAKALQRWLNARV